VNVFILLSEYRKFLPYQVELIRKWAPGVKNIVGIQGPFSPRKSLAGQCFPTNTGSELLSSLITINGEIPAGSKLTRTRNIVNYINNNYINGPTLIMHSDLFPVMPMVFKEPLCGSVGMSCQWLYLEKSISLDFYSILNGSSEPKYKFYPVKNVDGVQFFEPFFFHTDNILDVESNDQKLDFVKSLIKIKNDYKNPNMSSALPRFLKEYTKWTVSGGKYREDKEIEKIFEICKSCPYFEEHTPEEGQCTICTCHIKRTDKNMNKAAWDTTRCPLNPPRWK